MEANCPSCGAGEQSGRFCSSCGNPLRDASCPDCGNTLPAGARFCNQCGSAAPGTAATGSGRPAAAPKASMPRAIVPAVLGAVALAVVAAVVLLPRLTRESPDQAFGEAPIASVPGDPSAVDISSMTPRERADRLFNRVMQSVSAGDTAQAQAFLPMALAAYDQVPDLDLDGQYHFAVLQLVAGNPEAARARADSILAVEPSHLFGLFTAAQAEDALGNRSGADALYRRFLESYDTEVARELPEYQDHAQVLPVNRAEAVNRVGA